MARGYRSILALPLVVNDRAAGCLLLVSEEAGFFNAEEMRLLGELAARPFPLRWITSSKAERLRLPGASFDPLEPGLANRALSSMQRLDAVL